MATRRPRPSDRTTDTRSDPAPARATSRSPRTAARKVSSSAAVKPAKAPKLPKAVATAIEAARDKKALDTVVLDLRSVTFTDSQGASKLGTIAHDLRTKGLKFCLVGVRPDVMDVLTKDGQVEKIGPENFYLDVNAAVEANRGV
jgi:anti-anti-sigma factor